jgi:hypothetical protein
MGTLVLEVRRMNAVDSLGAGSFDEADVAEINQMFGVMLVGVPKVIGHSTIWYEVAASTNYVEFKIKNVWYKDITSLMPYLRNELMNAKYRISVRIALNEGLRQSIE